MNRIKFIHCADIHLEAPFASLGREGQIGSIRRKELRESFERIVKAAKDLNADFLFICGDLYEHAYATKGTFNFLNGLFEEIPSTTIVILPGNHDPYGANSGYSMHQWSDNVNILKPSISFLHFEEKGVRVYGAGISGSGEKQRLPVYVPTDEIINILLVHGSIDLNIGRCTFNPFSSEELAGCGMDYVAAGHFHNRLDDIGGKGVIYNPGSPEPLGFDEEGVHGFYAGVLEKADSGKTTLKLEFVKNNSRQYRNIEVRVDGCVTDDDTALIIYEEALKNDPARDLFSVTIKGYVDRNYTVDKNQVISILKDRLFFIRLKDETMPDYDMESLSKEPGIKGHFVRKLLKKVEQAPDEREKKRLLKALYLGLEALEGRTEIRG